MLGSGRKGGIRKLTTSAKTRTAREFLKTIIGAILSELETSDALIPKRKASVEDSHSNLFLLSKVTFSVRLGSGKSKLQGEMTRLVTVLPTFVGYWPGWR